MLEVNKFNTMKELINYKKELENAHNIIVLDNGRIVETGDHETLIHKKGAYYMLVRNQLELGE